jgi:glycosyltransferase involved in cell wall biosynthesis
MATPVPDDQVEPDTGSASWSSSLGKVALLTNFLPPYRIKVLELLQTSVGELRIFVSVRMESNRRWNPDWGTLKVIVQRTLSLSLRAVQPHRFAEDQEVHIPYDTLPLLARYRPASIIAAEFGMRTIQAALYKCIAPRTRLIVWATVSEITERYRGPFRRRLRRLILLKTDGVLVNGRSGQRYIQSLGYPLDKIYIVPQATDNSIFAGPNVRPPDPVLKLLYTGQLIERKGLTLFHEQLARWASANPERQVRWTIVGTGPLWDVILGWKLPPNYVIDLLGEVPFAELPAHYHRAGIFVLPTLADEWGLVVNEAMIAGLPVLGSLYSQAVEDLVTGGVDGWTFRTDRPEEVYDALDRALNASPEQLNAMRAHAIAAVTPIDASHMRDSIVAALVAPIGAAR